MTDEVRLRAAIPENMGGMRLDQALARMFPEYSRARLQQWIRSGELRVDGAVRRPRDTVTGGEDVRVDARLQSQDPCRAEAIELNIVYEDAAVLVVNKPAGLVVHPAAGNWAGTLQNALLHHDPDLAHLPRAGIVHRLDKDTTGLMVVARSLTAHKHLVDQLQQRTVRREYEAVVNGTVTAGGTIDAPIGRHPVDRKRMAVVEGGKAAISRYRVVERFRAHTRLQVALETGRTHQIRVHMASIRHPLVGDRVYGGRVRVPPQAAPGLQQALSEFKRQALHAARLALIHPVSGEPMEWQAALPEDMEDLLAALRADVKAHEGQ